MAEMVARSGFRSPELRAARERRRAIIAASPVRIEVIGGREWRVVLLPPPGDLWVAQANYNDGDGDDPDSPETA